MAYRSSGYKPLYATDISLYRIWILFITLLCILIRLVYSVPYPFQRSNIHTHDTHSTFSAKKKETLLDGLFVYLFLCYIVVCWCCCRRGIFINIKNHNTNIFTMKPKPAGCTYIGRRYRNVKTLQENGQARAELYLNQRQCDISWEQRNIHLTKIYSSTKEPAKKRNKIIVFA